MHMNIFIVYISMPTECSITLLTKLSSCVFADDKLLWYMPMEKFVDELSWRFFQRLCVCVQVPNDLIHFLPVNWVWSMPLHSTRWKLVLCSVVLVSLLLPVKIRKNPTTLCLQNGHGWPFLEQARYRPNGKFHPFQYVKQTIFGFWGVFLPNSKSNFFQS